jgi:acyl-CoA reductase-like NAD-dependent aldehyde dehydrogenase
MAPHPAKQREGTMSEMYGETHGERVQRETDATAAQLDAAEGGRRFDGPSVGAMLYDVRRLVESGRYELARDRAMETAHRPELAEGLMEAAAMYRGTARTYDGMADVLEGVAGELNNGGT